MRKTFHKNLPANEVKKVLMSTTGHRKLVNYLKELFKKESFKKDIRDIRIRLKTGLSSDLMDETVKLLDKYHLEFECLEFMMTYVTDNEFIEEFIGNMLFIEDIVDAKESLSNESNSITDEKFPVVIRVSPYASERDILDYVKKMYSVFILPIQERYKKQTTLGKVKNKRQFIQDRNDYIYENRHLPRKEIMRLVTDKFGGEYSIDYGYIGKIISLESKKRKEL
ncbi:MAG: hypothetical protein AAB447_02935 [Patescibacteria group bacterium]